MQRILTIVTWVTRFCLRSLHHRFVAWTKPDTTSLMLGTLTALVQSKSELVAENALLRQQLIILRRQVKRPACTKTDRMLLVLLARMVRTWKQALFIVQEDDAAALASPGRQDPRLANPGCIASRLPQKRVTSEWCANKRRVPGGGVGFNGEVADHQTPSPFFSDDDDNQGGVLFPGKILHASKRKPFHNFAFLAEEAAKQEGPEELKCSLFSGADS